MSRWTKLLAGCVLAAAAVQAQAVEVRTWAPASADDLSRGTMDSTAVDSVEGIRLAPYLETLWGPEVGAVWAVEPWSDGGALVALSDPARVMHVSASGEAAVRFEGGRDEIVTALLPRGGGGEFLLGLSPTGKVLQAGNGDVPEPVLESGSEYVWDLARDDRGNLWVATGSPGKVLVREKGKREEFRTVHDTGEDPVRCMAPLPGGGMAAGTGRQGRVLRVGPSGDVSVLFDAAEEEIVAVASGPEGSIWALAARKARPAPGKPTPPAPAAQEKRDDAGSAGGSGGSSVQVRVTASASPAPAVKGSKPAAKPAGGALYLIADDGGVDRVWSSRDGIPHALALDANGRPLVATGKDGRVLRIRRGGDPSVFLSIPSERATAIAAAPGGRLWIGGSDDARLAVAGPGSARAGTWLGEPVDGTWPADWGALEWNGTVPDGAEVKVLVRSGNTSEPDSTWSAWREVSPGGPGAVTQTGVPPGRYFQARFDLGAGRDGTSPTIRRIRLAYRTRNRPPSVEALLVDEPGVAWYRGPSQPSSRHGLQVAEDPVARRTSKKLNRTSRRGGPVRKSYEPGVRTFSWSASDPDGDAIRYSLEIQGENETSWFPLAEGIDDDFHSWDGRGMPDGVYRVRLVADDAPDNAEGANLQARKVSDYFIVDGTPPVMERIELTREGGRYLVRIRVDDAAGSIASMEYSLDGGEWSSLEPLDGVLDSGIEEFLLTLPRAGRDGTGRHLVLRVSDLSGNLSGERIVLED
jgi:hypothetical protein